MKKVIIFSGAGLSASSGISTFRDSDGLWENYDINRICSAGCLEWNYEETVEFYNLRRVDIKDKKPNNAHITISKLKEKYPQNIEVITQNVDDLLERAGCKEVVHLHGFLPQIKCMKCSSIVDIGYLKQDKTNNICKICDTKMRPNVVFFGEAAPMYEVLYDKLSKCDMLVVIGTSGNVIDVNFLSSFADITILNNLEASKMINEANFNKIYYEDAISAIEKIKIDIEEYLLDR